MDDPSRNRRAHGYTCPVQPGQQEFFSTQDSPVSTGKLPTAGPGSAYCFDTNACTAATACCSCPVRLLCSVTCHTLRPGFSTLPCCCTWVSFNDISCAVAGMRPMQLTIALYPINA